MGGSKRFDSKAAARSTARRIMSATFVDAGETVSRQCLIAQHDLPYVEQPPSDARTMLAAFFSGLLIVVILFPIDRT